MREISMNVYYIHNCYMLGIIFSPGNYSKKSIVLIFICIISTSFVSQSFAYNPCDGVQDGDNIVVEYNMTIESTEETQESDRRLSFDVDSNQLIQGFYEGLLGMKINETKEIVVPPSKGYTDPSHEFYGETLIFDVLLIDVENKSMNCSSNITDNSTTSNLTNNTVPGLRFGDVEVNVQFYIGLIFLPIVFYLIRRRPIKS